MSINDFFRAFDNKIIDKEKAKDLQQAKRNHYDALAKSFVEQLKPMLTPYIQGLEERGFRIKEYDNTPYYCVEFSNLDYKSVKLGVSHSIIEKERYSFSNYEEYGRQELLIDEVFPTERVRKIIEDTLNKLI